MKEGGDNGQLEIYELLFWGLNQNSKIQIVIKKVIKHDSVALLLDSNNISKLVLIFMA